MLGKPLYDLSVLMWVNSCYKTLESGFQDSVSNQDWDQSEAGLSQNNTIPIKYIDFSYQYSYVHPAIAASSLDSLRPQLVHSIILILSGLTAIGTP